MEVRDANSRSRSCILKQHELSYKHILLRVACRSLKQITFVTKFRQIHQKLISQMINHHKTYK